MSVVSVEIPESLSGRFPKTGVVRFETFIRNVDPDVFIEFDFKKERIDQNEFLAYLEKKNHG